MTLDLNAIRARFPSLATTDDGKRRIYLDNPAGTQVPQSVADAVAFALLHRSANQKGQFRTSRQVDELVAEARDAVADLLNARQAKEIIFGQNMTTLAFHLARSIGPTLSAGDEIIVTEMDHDANIHPWVMMARDHDLVIRWLPFDPETYELKLDKLDDLLGERTRLVCVSGASNLTGTLHDLETICRKSREAGAWTFIDAVQSVPHVPTDVQAIGCDFLACSAYKFFGPHQGILWGRAEVLRTLEAYQVRPAPQVIPGNFESGTPAFESMAGTTAAIEYFAWIGETMAQGVDTPFEGRRHAVHAAMSELYAYEKQLALHLIEGLEAIPGITVRGIRDAKAMDRRVPTVAFTHEATAPPDIARQLCDDNIFVWNGHNYAVELVRVLGLEDGVVRVGPVHYNTTDEVDELLEALRRILP